MSGTVELLGKEFGVAPKVGLMPLLRFAHLASQGVEADDMAALSAMYDLLQGVIADEDWNAFQNHATAVRADQDDLLEAVRGAIEAMAARPTQKPSDSSPGQPSDETSSSEGSSNTESSTPPSDTSSVARRRLGPIMDDPRVRELLPLDQAGLAV